jgi:hypothetical protein
MVTMPPETRVSAAATSANLVRVEVLGAADGSGVARRSVLLMCAPCQSLGVVLFLTPRRRQRIV